MASPNSDDRTTTTADGTCIDSTSSANIGPIFFAYSGAGSVVVDVVGDDEDELPQAAITTRPAAMATIAGRRAGAVAGTGMSRSS